MLTDASAGVPVAAENGAKLSPFGALRPESDRSRVSQHCARRLPWLDLVRILLDPSRVTAS